MTSTRDFARVVNPNHPANVKADAKRKLTDYDAVAICEGFDGEDHAEEEVIAAWQYLINRGLVWQLQGWYGRTAKSLIDAGICTAA